jgi:dihydropyrimidinase
MKKLLIKNGNIVNSEKIEKADILIENDKIKEIGEDLTLKEGEIIDAKGNYILPGIIDSHVHFQLPVKGTITADDFYTGTKAAACGGVTTIIDFAHPENKNESLLKAIEKRKTEANENVCVDYSLHAAIISSDDDILKEIPKLIDNGITSFKLYMTYREEGIMVDDADLYFIMKILAKFDGLPVVHAENNYLLEKLRAKYLSSDKTLAIYHARSRPNFAEDEAIRRVIYFADATNCPLFIFHLSTKEGLLSFANAKRKGKNVWAETCPHYLLLNENRLKGEDGNLFIMSPPLRTNEDKNALWHGLKRGDISIISTDHCSFNLQQKSTPDFSKVPSGLPGVETLLPIIYTHGVLKKRITINNLVEVLCENPAKIYGLYPRKGTVSVGSDADIVIFDPEMKATIDYKNLHMNVDWSPYQDWKLVGYPIYTILRGNIIYKHGKFYGDKRLGKFIRRDKSCLIENKL